MPDLEISDIINLRLLAHPVNWLVVWTVLLFGAFAFHLARDGGDPLAHPVTQPN